MRPAAINIRVLQVHRIWTTKTYSIAEIKLNSTLPWLFNFWSIYSFHMENVHFNRRSAEKNVSNSIESTKNCLGFYWKRDFTASSLFSLGLWTVFKFWNGFLTEITFFRRYFVFTRVLVKCWFVWQLFFKCFCSNIFCIHEKLPFNRGIEKKKLGKIIAWMELKFKREKFYKMYRP